MGALGCATCRMIRRSVLAFGLGAFLAWKLTGTLPTDPAGSGAWGGFMWVAVAITVLNVIVRMREMRSRFRSRHGQDAN